MMLMFYLRAEILFSLADVNDADVLMLMFYLPAEILFSLADVNDADVLPTC
jgi:hypothetical protein